MMECDSLISARARAIDVSGIRRVFELGASLTNPIDLSIGQPDFAVPNPIKEAAIDAIRADQNRYSLTQGRGDLRRVISEHLAGDVGWRVPSDDLELLVTSGTSGALLLAFLALLDPGDEAIIADPYFVIYPALGPLTGASIVYCDTYPDFRMTAQCVEPLITDRTKVLLLNSPSNPCGVVLRSSELRDLVGLCQQRGVLIVSDEIYDEFTYEDAREDGRCPSPARFTDRMLLVRGFGKTYGCTGWRMGYAAGPRSLIEQMSKLQQYTFVCAPSMAQAGVVAAFDVSRNSYRKTKQNLALAFAFNGIGVPLAVTGLVHPAWAMVAMIASVSTVLANSFGGRLLPKLQGGRQTHLTLTIANMHCEHCLASMKQAVGQLAGVEDGTGDPAA
ncbi:MAG: aminotransferase class I/II-fold pyridoxal phosphate-dependent enzyme, partial [Planctomycetes bacterium]|nr:aminotransferase class I/II-fold pyridoxal phosphate-dependent enzyme [Planctomycetota bacterium]